MAQSLQDITRFTHMARRQTDMYAVKNNILDALDQLAAQVMDLSRRVSELEKEG